MNTQTKPLPQPPKIRPWRFIPRTPDQVPMCPTPVERAFAIFGGPEGVKDALARQKVERHERSIQRWRYQPYTGFFPDAFIAYMRQAYVDAGYQVDDAFLTEPGYLPLPPKAEAQS
ncbi:hypothetical protein [Oceanicaulis sp. MMSF_3324]|uniref:hypothetical protein n=1 Tax=Oceanicaulis sp. MMSF_3324 TaxID=3046702 RepID=UPI00274017A8|nr:hypothetical protein [Oceanicaulis sp. MMSF_3324]